MTFLRAWRQAQGWSQAKAAEELDIPRNVYAQLEVGRLCASRLQRQKLAIYFGDSDRARAMLEPIPVPT